MTGYRPRELAGIVRGALESLPVVVVTGLRQAGKTTFLQQDPLFAGWRYLTLDDFATLEAARREPEALVAGEGDLILDEVQRCPELLLVLKREVDRRRRPGRFLLSGSANLSLMAGMSESLAGRALSLVLHPFTRRERRGELGEVPFLVRFFDDPVLRRESEVEPVGAEEVLDGGLPPIVLGETARRDLWLLGYEQTYLERDVRDLSQVADLVAFRALLRLTALRTGQILNHSELARDVKLPVSTVSRHLGILETSFIMQRLPPYLRSRATRLIKSPKVYVTDSGLAAHLTGVTELDPGERLRGPLYETFVFHNLAGILSAHLPRAELAFWHVQGRHEVDFVISQGQRALAIEVKAASRFHDADLAALEAFAARAPGTVAAILAYNGTQAVTLAENLFAVPLGLLLS